MPYTDGLQVNAQCAKHLITAITQALVQRVAPIAANALTSSKPTICGTGTYSGPNDEACSDCTAGHYCPIGAIGAIGAIAEILCLAGTYSAASNAAACTVSVTGMYSGAGYSLCTDLT